MKVGGPRHAVLMVLGGLLVLPSRRVDRPEAELPDGAAGVPHGDHLHGQQRGGEPHPPPPTRSEPPPPHHPAWLPLSSGIRFRLLFNVVTIVLLKMEK